VRLLGAVRFVTEDGETVDLPSASQRRLLAALALVAGATLRPEYLSDLLDVSSGALRTTVSRLRARLGEAVIRTDAVGYRITCAVDTTLFTDLLLEPAELPDRLVALDRALELWDGEALDEFRHEPWAEAEAARLDELRYVAVEDRAELLIGRARAGEAVASLEAHVAVHPLRDRARGLLIQALASDGRQADALRAYQDYRAVLAEETGTEPSALVRSIERRVAAGWSGDRADAADVEGGSAPVVTASAFDVPLPGVLAQGRHLIGRRRELTWLESELVQARAGSLRIVLLSGEAGIGKTTLLAALARTHGGHGGTTVVYGRCDEGAAVPLQPFRDVVGSLVDYAPKDVLRAHCERYGGELARIAPHLLNRVWAPPPTSGDDATERYQLFESVADLLRRLAAAGPLVLVLDDLHWAEPTALLLLRHLARALIDVPVLVVASFRDTLEQSTELLAALADLEGGDTRRIALAGFDDAELSDLVVSVTDAPSSPAGDVLEQLRVQTAGNPLYAVQLVRHLVESGHLVVGDGVHLSGAFAATEIPASLLAVVWSRVRALGDVAHDVLQAGSVLGIEFDGDTLVEMIDGSADEVAAALDLSVGAGLLAETDEMPPTMRFTHALVAHALYSELGGARRRRLHEQAARALEKGTDMHPPTTVAALARHWALAGDLLAAQRWATVAGDHALEHLAPNEAATWYETALEHATTLPRPAPERADLMVRRGAAQQRSGDPRARATLLEAADLAQRCGAPAVLIRAALATDRGLGRVGAVDTEQLAVIEAAIDVADPADPNTYARLLALYALGLIHTPRYELRHAVARQAVELIDASDDPMLLLHTISALTFALEGPGTLPLRRELTLRSVASARTAENPVLQLWTSRAAYFVAIESGDPQLARESLELITAIAAEVGEPRLRWVAAIYQAFEAMMEARLDDAERFSERSLEIGTEIGEPDAFSLYAGQLFANRSFAGRYDELLPLVQGVVEANPGYLPFRLAFAIVCLAVDREDEARAILREGADGGFSAIPADYTWMTTIIGYAVLAIGLEDDEVAAQLYEILEPFGDEVAFSGATSQGPISAYLGKLASVIGRHDVADAHLRQALEVTRAFGWRYHEATTLVALALSQKRRTGALDDAASAWLDTATAIGVDRDLPGVVAQAESVRA
jgi:DNA-binding SARP family transcriptional activator/tetratricopeptide (TPR) repeat protein